MFSCKNPDFWPSLQRPGWHPPTNTPTRGSHIISDGTAFREGGCRHCSTHWALPHWELPSWDCLAGFCGTAASAPIPQLTEKPAWCGSHLGWSHAGLSCLLVRCSLQDACPHFPAHVWSTFLELMSLLQSSNKCFQSRHLATSSMEPSWSHSSGSGGRWPHDLRTRVTRATISKVLLVQAFLLFCGRKKKCLQDSGAPGCRPEQEHLCCPTTPMAFSRDAVHSPDPPQVPASAQVALQGSDGWQQGFFTTSREAKVTRACKDNH